MHDQVIRDCAIIPAIHITGDVILHAEVCDAASLTLLRKQQAKKEDEESKQKEEKEGEGGKGREWEEKEREIRDTGTRGGVK